MLSEAEEPAGSFPGPLRLIAQVLSWNPGGPEAPKEPPQRAHSVKSLDLISTEVVITPGIRVQCHMAAAAAAAGLHAPARKVPLSLESRLIMNYLKPSSLGLLGVTPGMSQGDNILCFGHTG